MPVETRISFSDGSSSETLRKLSDDLSRKHLSDLIEDEEDDVSSSLPDRPRSAHRKASTSSTYSITSMDALWEKHPRRLSEAGLRRTSDHSVVLTEDTDSFIIGERVWVGGTKPGQIAYIGETQFAPGEWAGIVLDEPIGKNDGSVAGVRYFQCQEKRGVFSRLTRLTRVPLITHAPHDASPVSDAGSVFERPPSGSARPRRTLSPNGSVRSMVSSKMNASISTTTNGELRMGDRVIVSSSRGSKAGTLRFIGNTDFAAGIWAGVELDDPLGKNDGSVEGKRYFECAPRFGLFAPISKVSRSPSNRKPGACAIHSNGRATPLRRSNSRDSLTSLGTSIASSRVGVRLGMTPLGAQRVGGPRASSTPVSAKNALQEMLREKQQHLEKLMKERELERSEVAKVSLQADRAETALAQLRKETAQTNTENEKLKAELDKLVKQLEDERQRVEDLMFRNEEENINKEDYYKYKEAMEKEKEIREHRIRELEAEVALQAARADTTAAAMRAADETRAAETSVLLEQHREELVAAQTLSSELQKLLDEAYALLKEKESEKDSLGKSMSDELNKVKAESEKALNEAKTKITIAQTEFETQISVLTAKLQLAESKLEMEKQNLERLDKENSNTIIDLNTKLTQLQAAVDDKTIELNKVMGANKEHELNLNKEITKLKMELSAKILDLEQLTDANQKQASTCKTLQDEINRVKEEHTSKINEYESLLSEVSQQNEKNQSEILELQQNLSAKTKEYEKLLTDSSSSNSSTEKLIEEYKQVIHERDKEVIKLKDEYEQATANFNINHSKIAEEHRKEIEDRNTKIEQLMKEIENHQQALDLNKLEFETLNSKFSLNVDELKALKEENERLRTLLQEQTQINTDIKSKISEMELEIGELKRQLASETEKCSEIIKCKEKLESEYLSLTGQTTDSNEQFNKLSHHLKETEKELQELKDKHREVANNHGRIEQELKQKLFKIQEDFSLERSQLLQSIEISTQKLETVEHKAKDADVQLSDLNIKLKDIETNNDKLLDENSILKQEIEALKIKEQELNNEHDAIRKKLEVDNDRYKEEICLLKAEGATSEVKLMEKVDQLTEAQNDLNNKLEEARKHEDSLQKILDDMTSQLNNQKAHYEKEIAQLTDQINIRSQESDQYKAIELELKNLLQEKQNALKDMNLKLEMLEVDLKSNIEIVNEKERQITQVSQDLNKTTENKNILEEKLNTVTMEMNTLKQKYDSLVTNSTAEDTLVKEQLGQLEAVKKEINVLVQDKSSLEIKYNEAAKELDLLKSEHEKTLQRYAESVELTNALKKSVEETNCLLKSHVEANESTSNIIKSLESELGSIKEELSNNNKLLQEKETQIVNLNDAVKCGTSQSREVIQRIQKETSELNEKHKKEIDALNSTVKALQNTITDHEKQQEELQQTKDKVTELQQLLSKSESDIKQLSNINDGQKANYEDLNKQLQAQFDDHKKDNKRARHELKLKVIEYEKELMDTREKLQKELQKHTEAQKKLADSEKTASDLSQKLELITIQQSSDAEKDDNLTKLTIELQACRRSNEEIVASNEVIVKNLRTEIDSRIADLKKKDELLLKLQDDLKNYKAKVEILEREKVLLQKEIASRKDNNDNNAMGVLGQGDNALQKMEDKEMLDGQVSFLNAVIVDMQRKNEQLTARVHALEGGAPPEPVFNGRKARALAPRLFCDICDIFDAHDTEECPRQGPAPEPRRAPPPPRPYCDICEVFGHATENCDEEETF